MEFEEIGTTKDVKVPTNPIDRVIGQERVVEKVKLAIKQRRHLLLVGPPGIGKSMLAQALALCLPKAEEQISVVHNPNNPQRPLVDILRRGQLEGEDSSSKNIGTFVSPKDVPAFVAERLGFRCSNCGMISDVNYRDCSGCGADKYGKVVRDKRSPFGDIITDVFELGYGRPENEIQTVERDKGGNEKFMVYQRAGRDKIRVLDQNVLAKMEDMDDKRMSKVVMPLNRGTFVHATGASETELVGDVRHDPYGGHPEIGTPAYLRIVPGAIHEAHEGVLFIDELPHLGHLQNYILTAMQEKKFSIVGRNPQSAGASVKVKDVPCDFLFVGACNIIDIGGILPPLRSRILGNGYEILLDTTMPDTEENRGKMAQFVAQEILIDGRIPHATREAIEEIIGEGRRRAKKIDDARDSITLRFRDLGGVIRMAGDFAVLEGSELIEKRHIERGIEESKPIEHQLQRKYGSVWKGMGKDDIVKLNDSEDKRGYV